MNTVRFSSLIKKYLGKTIYLNFLEILASRGNKILRKFKLGPFLQLLSFL
jgi:hypothetical protein